MALLETQLEILQVVFILMAVVFPAWFIILLWKADKDPQVDPMEIAKQESS
ncbi:MAG: hypothetical protein QXF40_05955 [Metallosphaera sp.]